MPTSVPAGVETAAAPDGGMGTAGNLSLAALLALAGARRCRQLAPQPARLSGDGRGRRCQARLRALTSALGVLALGMVLLGVVLPGGDDDGYTSLDPAAPVRLSVPSLDIRPPSTSVEVGDDRVLDPPADVLDVGWWDGSALPGQDDRPHRDRRAHREHRRAARSTGSPTCAAARSSTC